MRLIVRFERLEEIKYISQLDMLRTIHRALRRADIPAAYSEGFNPQPKVSFGFALSVGMVSYGEYMDIQLKDDMSAELFVEKMNTVLPKGMRFTDATAVEGVLPKIGRLIDCAEFETTFFSSDAERLSNEINAFFSQNEVIIERHSKKGAAFTDVKPWIYRADVYAEDGVVKLNTVQALSEQMSVRIDDVIAAVKKQSGELINGFTTYKKDTLLRDGCEFITPINYARKNVN